MATSRPRSLSMGDAMRFRDFGSLHMHTQEDQVADEAKVMIEAFLAGLPHLTEQDLARLDQLDATCPVCLNPLLTILTEEEMALAMDSPAHAPADELGVTRLAGCGHIFCRKDIINWLAQGRNTCPACRHTLIADLPAGPSVPYDIASEFPLLARAALPLTPEQASSFHSAIMLLSQGDDGRFVLPMPMPSSPPHEPNAARSQQQQQRQRAADAARRQREENERRQFAGMYS